MPELILVGIVVLVVAGEGLLTVHGLVRRRARTREAWSQIDVELTRRHELIPKLVEMVQGCAADEQVRVDAVTAALAGAVNAQAAGDPNRVRTAEDVLTSTVRSLLAVAEGCPPLRADEGFLQVQEQLTATDDRLERARRNYNSDARDYNNAIVTFPRNLLAGPSGFTPITVFAAGDAHPEALRIAGLERTARSAATRSATCTP